LQIYLKKNNQSIFFCIFVIFFNFLTTLDNERIILGIDPGTIIMGYGLIRCTNSTKPELLVLGAIELQKYDEQFVRLKKIFDKVVGLIDCFHVTELAIEAPFYGKNVQSMLKLGRAQGTAIAAALSRSLEVYEYAPRKIKLAITGQGNASKEQVAALLKKILTIPDMPENFDATDGLAAAMCHFYQKKTSVASGNSAKSWKEFVSNNPKRVKAIKN